MGPKAGIPGHGAALFPRHPGSLPDGQEKRANRPAKDPFALCFLWKLGRGSVLVLPVKFIVIELGEIEKFSQGHVKGKGDFVQGFYPWIFGQAPDDVVQRGLPDIAHGSQAVNGDVPGFAELPDSIYIELCVFHGGSPLWRLLWGDDSRTAPPVG